MLSERIVNSSSRIRTMWLKVTHSLWSQQTLTRQALIHKILLLRIPPLRTLPRKTQPLRTLKMRRTPLRNLTMRRTLLRNLTKSLLSLKHQKLTQTRLPSVSGLTPKPLVAVASTATRWTTMLTIGLTT